MHDIPEMAVPRAIADAPLNEDVGGARPADAIFDAPSAPALTTRLLTRRPLKNYGPRAALAAWLVGVVWLVGSHFVGSPPAVVQQESLQTAGMGEAAQKMAEAAQKTAEAPPAQKVDPEPTGALQSPAAKDFGVASAKPGPAKTEISAVPAEVSGKVEPVRRKFMDKPAKAKDRVDRIGLEIAALLAAAPAAKSSHSAAPVTRKSAHGGRGDAFDPSQNPTAPGAPRPLGAIASPAVANNLAANNAPGRRTD